MLRRVFHPVVLVLFLAGLFDGIAGNWIHALILFATAVMAAWWRDDRGAERDVATVERPLWEWRRSGVRPRWLPIAIAGTAAYATVVGGMERYTWPFTVFVIIPGILVLMVAGSTPEDTGPEPKVDRLGSSIWLILLVVIAIFELVNFILQPEILPGEQLHPTLSRVFNVYVTGHAGQSLALFLWLMTGWWLMER